MQRILYNSRINGSYLLEPSIFDRWLSTRFKTVFVTPHVLDSTKQAVVGVSYLEGQGIALRHQYALGSPEKEADITVTAYGEEKSALITLNLLLIRDITKFKHVFEELGDKPLEEKTQEFFKSIAPIADLRNKLQ